MKASEKIAGTWVADGDMNPMTNIYGRRYWTPEFEGEYRGFWPANDGLKPKIIYWHFPENSRDQVGADIPCLEIDGEAFNRGVSDTLTLLPLRRLICRFLGR